MKKITISTEYITLGQFLKIAEIIQSGGRTKGYLLNRYAIINGEKENRRGRKLRGGDVIDLEGETYLIEDESQ